MSAMDKRHCERTLVGVCDREIPISDTTTWQLNKLGGYPDWMYHDCDYPSCTACGDPLYHVAQMYCPLEASSYHRTLYIFACVRNSCSNSKESWRVFRSQRLASQSRAGPKRLAPTAAQAAVAAATDEWCEDADDWGGDESGEERVDPSSGDAVAMATLPTLSTSKDESLPRATADNSSLELDPSDAMTRLSLCTPDTPLDSDSVLSRTRRGSFRGYYVSVFEEPPASSLAAELTNHERELIADYQQREGVELSEWQEEHLQMTRMSPCEESYEKTSTKHGDKVFQKFTKRLQLCPEQCIRYCRNGTPLYPTSPSEGAAVPRCPHCGGRRVFEVQLMPQLIHALHDADQPGTQLEFGVVIIYTCQASCWDDPLKSTQPNRREEHVDFQRDPDSSLIARSTIKY